MTGANPHRGEIAETIGEREFVLCFRTNELVLLERKLGMPAHQVGEMLQRREPSIEEVRVLLWASLQRHQPDMDEAAVGDLIDEIGATTALTLVMRAFIESAPQRTEGAGDGPAHPPKATAAGIGHA